MQISHNLSKVVLITLVSSCLLSATEIKEDDTDEDEDASGHAEEDPKESFFRSRDFKVSLFITFKH